MITDVAALNEIRQSWAGVEALKNRAQLALLGSFAQGATSMIFITDSAHNLPFVQAFAVLNDVLVQLRDEKKFQCKSIFLGSLLAKSQHKLPWKEFALIKEGVERRNDVTHRGNVLPRADCWRYIEGIKSQLVDWGILDKD